MMRANNIIGSIDDVARALAGARDVVVCGHVSPDGDCLGSTLGLVHALRAAGISATALKAQDEPVEYGLRFLPGAAELVAACDYAGPVGTFVTVDVPSADRMGDAAAALHARGPHGDDRPPSGQGDFSDVCYVDPMTPSASLLVWEVVKRMGIEPNAAVATCCYTGLNTDTGRFSFQNATYAAFRAASQMVAAGAEPAVVAREVYQNRSMAPSSSKPWRSSACSARRGLLRAHLPAEIGFRGLRRGCRTPIPSSTSYEACAGAGGLRPAREQEDVVRGSLRAKDDTDVLSAIAERIGGGGHRAAAGFTFLGTMDEARALMLDEFTALGARGK